jgi:hypothetical protein
MHLYIDLDEELKFLMLKRRCVSIYGGYKVNHKAAHNHFQRYSDVKAKGRTSKFTLFEWNLVEREVSNGNFRVSLFMNANLNPYSDPDNLKQRHINPYPVSFFCLRSERIFWQNSSWTSFWTKAGYSFMSRCFVWIRVRITISAKKQRDMNL